MPLAVGTRIGPYEVLAPLGAGGMGEVFRARDTRLKRDVALKMLPDAFAADADRIARFRREAEILASLNHPNIAAIFSLEIGECATAIAMELVEGETLAERIARGRVPVDEAIRIAVQIAGALDAAHERGVVHRDLKPANISFTPNDDVKVLDFGLAKLADGSDSSGSSGLAATLAPTTVSPPIVTAVGIVLGTAAYMAPEQARGQAVDRRSDIWAFGCILFEMLTGTRAFPGDSVVDTLSAVIHRDPDWNALPAGVPAHIRMLLQRCLAKDRRQRLRDIGDIPWEPIEARAAARTSTAMWIAWAIAAGLAVVAGASWLRAPSDSSPQPVFSITVLPPLGLEFSSLSQELSPNGSAVAYVAFENTLRQSSGNGVYVRHLGELEPRLVPGAESPLGPPVWSPDSSAVAFVTPRGLVKVRLPDGPAQLISDPLDNLVPRGLGWSDNGTILITMPLMAVSESGGRARPITVPGLSGQIQSPEFLPGSDDLLFLLNPEVGDDPEIYLGTLRGDTIENATLLFKNDTAARYTPAGGGRLMFVRNDVLYGQRLNRSTRALEGDPEVITRGVSSMPGNTFYRAYFSVSRTGTIAWKPGTADAAQVTVFNRRGEQLGAAGPPSLIVSIVLSPDESRLLAFSPGIASVVEVGQSGRVPIPRGARWFGWSSDGARILGIRQPGSPYSQSASVSRGPASLVEVSADGAGGIQPIGDLAVPVFLNPQDVSPDETRVLGQDGDDITVLRADRNATPAERSVSFLVDEAQRVHQPRFSPDGRWVVFEDATERSPGPLYVQSVDGPRRRRQVSAAGTFPEWRRDGKEIVFALRAELWSVQVIAHGDDLSFGPAVKLFGGLRTAAGTTVASRALAVSRDGSRIFTVQKVEQREPNVIHVRTGALR